METFDTKYGKITLYSNDCVITPKYRVGEYWEESNLLGLKQYIPSNRNILEIGGHCGTSSLFYEKCLDNDKKLYVYEPQKNTYNLLFQNINQNNLQNKIIPNNLGVFCYSGAGKMNNIDLDGCPGATVEKRYNEENNLPCNFAGIGLGSEGETINLITVDDMNLEDIGFIHCDAQGSENFIFSKAIETIQKYRPVILYENYDNFGPYLYNVVKNSYPQYNEESLFDIKKYCMENLGYTRFIDRFNGGIDTLLIP